ncbi:MAG: hypothetical protein K0Q63_3694, partial [Paenibacillus sp.]|nr:hypothetical protein [Paenibacillus sp.]
MRRLNIKWVAALACLLAAAAAATWIYLGSRGVPAIGLAAYVQAQEGPPTSELSLRQDGLVPDMKLAAESPEL